MRAREFVSESKTGSLQSDVAKALPATYVIPKLQNNDPYHQYRFGVAIAGAKGREQRAKDNVASYSAQTPWGENEIVVSYDSNIENWLDDALQQIGMSSSDKKLISTRESQETEDVSKNSPISSFRGYDK